MKTTESAANGVLYIVATPIGNLEDITLRAIRILKEVDYIAAEDTRHTKKLLSHLDIHTQLISYYREQENRRADAIIQLLLEGKNIGLVSDAGTPGISDPGAVVVQRAFQNSINVVPIPGPSALSTALSCSGIGDTAILFHGFAPAKKNQRKQLFHSLTHCEFYTVFYESPHRLDSFIEDAYAILGDRKIFVARELTKNFEELTQSSLKQLAEATGEKKNRGEFVLIIAPAESVPSQEMNMDELILWYRDNSSLSLKDCCKKLATDLGVSRSNIYKRALQLWDTEGIADDR